MEGKSVLPRSWVIWLRQYTWPGLHTPTTAEVLFWLDCGEGIAHAALVSARMHQCESIVVGDCDSVVLVGVDGFFRIVLEVH
jgi:hypothetical protein